MAYRDSDLRGGRILPKRSAVPNEAPSAGALRPGELAANTADGILYVGKSDGTVSQAGGGVSGTFIVLDENSNSWTVQIQDGRVVGWSST